MVRSGSARIIVYAMLKEAQVYQGTHEVEVKSIIQKFMSYLKLTKLSRTERIYTCEVDKNREKKTSDFRLRFDTLG